MKRLQIDVESTNHTGYDSTNRVIQIDICLLAGRFQVSTVKPMVKGPRMLASKRSDKPDG